MVKGMGEDCSMGAIVERMSLDEENCGIRSHLKNWEVKLCYRKIYQKQKDDK